MGPGSISFLVYPPTFEMGPGSIHPSVVWRFGGVAPTVASMARRPRVHLDDVPLHIVQRGHNREPCFFAEADYRVYLHWLGPALRDAQCALHAYALMTNHVHLLVTPRQAVLVPKLLISLGRRYVQYVNNRYRRTGTPLGQQIQVVAGAIPRPT